MRKNRRGEGYILPCVLILAISMVASMLIVFATALSVLRLTKDNVTITLDSYVMENSVVIYDSIKQGSNRIEAVDQDTYVDQLRQFASLDQRGEFLYSYGSGGAVNYYMTIPQLQSNANTLQLEVSYTQYVPIRFFGAIVVYAEVPVTVTSSFHSKF